MVIIAAILGFLTVAGLGFAFAGPSASEKTARRAQAIVNGGPGQKTTAKARKTDSAEDRRKQILKTLKEHERAQKKDTVSIAARLQQAGLKPNVQLFWIWSAAAGALAGGGALVAGQNIWIVLGASAAAGLGLPRWIIGTLINRRMKKFTEHFADAVDIIVRGIRSGLPVHDCLKIIGKETPEPLAGEFRSLVETLSVGVPMEQALEKVYQRMPTSEMRFFSIVVSIQQKTGGNLAEALSNLSAVLRARKMMREKIKALSSEAIASAFIIGCLPPGVVAMISVTQPAYMATMYSDPRGHMMLMGGALWMAMGIFVMRKMINFKF